LNPGEPSTFEAQLLKADSLGKQRLNFSSFNSWLDLFHVDKFSLDFGLDDTVVVLFIGNFRLRITLIFCRKVDV
jgi:hypothetical protein